MGSKCKPSWAVPAYAKENNPWQIDASLCPCPYVTHALLASALAKACQYTLMLWPKLIRFLEYPELELSNNLAENSMRPAAVGLRNWIHIGSAEAGPKIAAILSVVKSCRRMETSRA